MNENETWGFPSLEKLDPAQTLTLAISRIYRRGLTTPTGGNLSVRTGDGATWLTPSSIDKGALKPEYMACVMPDGKLAGPYRPSIEAPFHLLTYKLRPDVKAVVHAHPVSLVAASACGAMPKRNLFAQVRDVCPKMAFAPYALPGSAQLGDCVAEKFADGTNAVLMESHGVAIAGANMADAIRRFEVVEHLADIELAAKSLGGAREIGANTPAPIFETLHSVGLSEDFPEDKALRDTLAMYVRRAYIQRLAWPAQFSFSARIGKSDWFLIHAENADPASLSPKDLIKVNARDLSYMGNDAPHPWAALHARAYRQLADCGAVFFSTPTAVGAFCVTDVAFEARTIPESYILLRDARCLGEQWWCDGAAQWLDGLSLSRPVSLLAHTGAGVVARNAFVAFDTMEVLESTARSIIAARSLGKLHPMNEAAVADIKKAFRLE